MKNINKMRWIMYSCMAMVILFSSAAWLRSVRPSEGKPYEQLSSEEAQEYMAYEGKYYLLDVSAQVDESCDDPYCVHIPYEQLLDRIEEEITDRTSVIYIKSKDTSNDRKAAMKLCHIGYTGVAVITGEE
ncbi:MAG: hypothetical protein Q4B59_04895 [Lachnospiraceae bacterium]|nr:hypothetical protein [Lachnospiraceae bacterium]